jgi:transcriptional regulator with XRE-family HTH domain
MPLHLFLIYPATARLSRIRDYAPLSRDRPEPEAGLSRVSDTPARHQAFANFVRKSLTDARSTQGWNGSEVARRTGLSRQTINRWLRGEWSSDPEPARVVAFCEALGISPTKAFGVLGWDRSAAARPVPQAPLPPMDPDVEALLRRLVDPSVSDAEKYHMRETIRYLAYRPSPPESGEERRRAG